MDWLSALLCECWYQRVCPGSTFSLWCERCLCVIWFADSLLWRRVRENIKGLMLSFSDYLCDPSFFFSVTNPAKSAVWTFLLLLLLLCPRVHYSGYCWLSCFLFLFLLFFVPESWGHVAFHLIQCVCVCDAVYESDRSVPAAGNTLHKI